MKLQEGYMPFLGYRTYYRIVGEASEKKSPLVLLHGGPGSGHDYFEVLDRLSEEDGRQIVMYDQLGCGRSYLDGHPELWRMETWMEELKALRRYLHLEKIHLLGQSWGGMLLLDYVCRHQPKGLKSLILSSTLPSSRMWGEEQHRMISELPPKMQDAIRQAEESGDYTDGSYLAAEEEFMLRHAAGEPGPNAPECLTRCTRKGREAYVTAWGPNEFTPQGTLRDYDVTQLLGEIREPTLVISGGNDLCTPYIAKYMYDRIPNAQWELFRTCRHMCFVEENDRYVELLKQWLHQYD